MPIYFTAKIFCCLCLFRSFICRCVFFACSIYIKCLKNTFFCRFVLILFFYLLCSHFLFLLTIVVESLEVMCSFFSSLLSICWLANNISDTMARMQMKADSQWTNIYSDGDKYTIRDSRSNLLYVFIIHVFLLIEYFVVAVVVSTRRCCCC